MDYSVKKKARWWCFVFLENFRKCTRPNSLSCELQSVRSRAKTCWGHDYGKRRASLCWSGCPSKSCWLGHLIWYFALLDYYCFRGRAWEFLHAQCYWNRPELSNFHQSVEDRILLGNLHAYWWFVPKLPELRYQLTLSSLFGSRTTSMHLLLGLPYSNDGD